MKNLNILLIALAFVSFSCRNSEPLDSASRQNPPEEQPVKKVEQVNISESPFNRLNKLTLPITIQGGIDATPAFPFRETDSLFIVNYINPGYYGEQEPQYQYGAGAVAIANKNFVAIVYPFEHTFGRDYVLHTYQMDGQMLDTMMLAQTAGDYYYQSATIKADGKISIERHYLDGVTPTLHAKAVISSWGKIEKKYAVKGN